MNIQTINDTTRLTADESGIDRTICLEQTGVDRGHIEDDEQWVEIDPSEVPTLIEALRAMTGQRQLSLTECPSGCASGYDMLGPCQAPGCGDDTRGHTWCHNCEADSDPDRTATDLPDCSTCNDSSVVPCMACDTTGLGSRRPCPDRDCPTWVGKCHTCHWYEPMVSGELGECKVEPPAIVPTGHDQAIREASMWGRCSRWEARR